MKKLFLLLIVLFACLGIQSCVGSKNANQEGYNYKDVIAKIAIEELKLRYQKIEFSIHLDSTEQKVVRYIEQGRKLFAVKVDSVAPGKRKIIVTPDYDALEKLLTTKRKKYEKLLRKRR